MIGNYSWNIANWVPRMLPLKRRTEFTIAWLVACLSGVQVLVNDFSTKCQEWDFRVLYNSQQKVLSALLNKLFDATSKRIRVETIADIIPPMIVYHDSELPEAPVVYFDSESAPMDVIINHDSESASALDFRVFVPSALSGLEEQIKAWINRYVLADKQYEIIYF